MSSNMSSQPPIFKSAAEYVSAMQIGINSDACKTRPARKAYSSNPALYQDFYDRGFRHIRLRIVNDVTTEEVDSKGNLVGGVTLLNEIELAVQRSLDAGLLPIVAYGGGPLEEAVTPENEQKVYAWWQLVAQKLSRFDNRVSFNFLIEIGSALSDAPETVNRVYDVLIRQLRADSAHAHRVLFCAPVKLSAPEMLTALVIPYSDPFVAVEVHDYAAGPTKDATSKKYWNESDPSQAVRDVNRQRIRDSLQAATDWHSTHQIPVWFGALLPAPYNKDGGVFTIEEQVGFVRFFASELAARGIPVAWNSDDKFITLSTRTWIPEQIPVVDAMLAIA